MKTVFLGGTCNGSQWREALIAMLTNNVDAFNPVVADWTPECQAEEIRRRETSDFALYVITPKMTGTYSIAEAVDDSNKRPEKTIFCFLHSDGEEVFAGHQVKALNAVAKLIASNGAQYLPDLEHVANFLNRPIASIQQVQGFESQGVDFGHALAAAKAGKCIAREGWNGKGMYLYYVPAASYAAATDAARKEFGDMVPYGAYIAMKTAQNNVVPWLASQTDVLANDWVVLD